MEKTTRGGQRGASTAPAGQPDEARVAPGVRLARWAARTRADLSLLMLDALVTGGAYVAVLVLRFDGAVPAQQWQRFWSFLPLAVVVHVAANFTWRLYRRMWTHASVEEARRLLVAGTLSVSTLLSAELPRVGRLPVSVMVLGGCVATMLMGAVRFQSRLFAFKRSGDHDAAIRVAVIGAGESGAAMVREMLRDGGQALRPVVVLDDNPRKQGRSLLGVPIAGGVADLAALGSRFEVHQALLAVPSATNEQVERVAAAAAQANLPLKVLPGVAELVLGKPSIGDVRDVRIEDLLGRAQVEIDLDAVRALLAGRRVLVTGAGGSIGSEIVRQVAACGPDRLIALDHDETHLHDVVQTVPGPVTQVLADVRDAAAVDRVFEAHLPEVVFHAAAHKHVPILETHACEAAATNVVGTQNVVRSSGRVGTRHVVVISTDKAVQPASVMGASKWMSEQVVLAMAPEGGRYCAVRFGNVLGSRGSVIPTFTRQIAAGGPVTVTDPRMTRFFMSIDEAVRLVLQAAALTEGREIFMLDMGEPVRIWDLAEKMIRLSGLRPDVDVKLEVTGMRPGEKLEEELRAPGEAADPTTHPSILRVRPVRLPRPALEAAIDQLAACIRSHRHDDAAGLLRALPFGDRVPDGAPAGAPELLDARR